MKSVELMQEFVTRYVAKDRRDRWLGISKKRDKLYAKLGTLSNNFGGGATFTEEDTIALFTRFIKHEGAVWVWDFSRDDPVCVTSFDQIPPDYLGRSLIGLAEKSKHAVYSYDEGESFMCA
jgi:hypothetical protein